MAGPSMKHGDFSALAADYARYRPGYAANVLTSLLALPGKPAREIDAVDVGAGTGLWTTMLAGRDLKSVVAVEPNDEMRREGIIATSGRNIVWCKGAGEATGLPSGSCDIVSMASSFPLGRFRPRVRRVPAHPAARRMVRRFMEPPPHRGKSGACRD